MNRKNIIQIGIISALVVFLIIPLLRTYQHHDDGFTTFKKEYLPAKGIITDVVISGDTAVSTSKVDDKKGGKVAYGIQLIKSKETFQIPQFAEAGAETFGQQIKFKKGDTLQVYLKSVKPLMGMFDMEYDMVVASHEGSKLKSIL